MNNPKCGYTQPDKKIKFLSAMVKMGYNIIWWCVMHVFQKYLNLYTQVLNALTKIQSKNIWQHELSLRITAEEKVWK